MASSIIGGLLSSHSGSGTETVQVWAFDRNDAALSKLEENHGVRKASSNIQLVEHCDVIVVAVKPQVLKSVLQPLVDVFSTHQPLIVSVVAGISSATIEKWLQRELAIVRIMPNTPALIGQGASGMFANSRVTLAQRNLTTNMANAIGIGHWVANESDIDSVTALSGSGPAYFMLFIKSLIDASVEAGLEPEQAKELAVQTAVGAAELIRQSEVSIDQLINNVTSPNGTTEQALLSFQRNKLEKTVGAAFKAAKTRSEQLSIELAD